jgi:hypothetical protein
MKPHRTTIHPISTPVPVRALGVALLACAVSVLGLEPRALAAAQGKGKGDRGPGKAKVGLLVHDPRACKGYTLLASSASHLTYLIDMDGRVVNTWKSDCNPGASAYLLENGHLLRTGEVKKRPFFGGGAGGRIQEFTWDGNLVWDFTYVTDTRLPNHDICKLPNGNVLMLVWDKKSARDALAAGRRPEAVGEYLLTGSLLEVQPTGKTTGKIVWEWHAWDHLIQDFDEKQANHGNVGEHPERIDINFGDSTVAAIGARGRKGARPQTDWLHINAVAYNADLDQVILSVWEFNEIWVLDHGTTTAESAGHKGGRYGKGGDLLYRWGNPRAYRAGGVKDQQLFGQHNAHWIPRGRPGAGHILLFNNGMRRPGGAYSTVDEIVLPVDAKGRYERRAGKAFGPERPLWTYAAPKKADFYAPFISGAERVPNGNTLICSGTNGTIFEVTPKGEVVWKYVNPTKANSPFAGPGKGGPPFGGPKVPPPRLGQLLAPFLQGAMRLTADQKKQLQATERELGEKLAKLLTAEQKAAFTARPLGFGELPPAGQLLSSPVRERLKLTAEQSKGLASLQTEADSRLAKILEEGQRKQLKKMQDFARRFQGGPGGGFPGFGPVGGAGIFRAPRYAPDFPGLAGKELKPGKTIEELP